MPTDILRICDEIDKAAGKATPRPWDARYLADDDFVIQRPGYEIFTPEYDVVANIHRGAPIRKREDAAYIALAANHATDLTALVRRLVEYAQIVERIPNEKMTGVQWQLHQKLDQITLELRRDYPGLLDAAKPEEMERQNDSLEV